jgi:hypothetical protein
MLSLDQKQRVWWHLLGNYLNAPPSLIRKRSHELVAILDKEPEKIKDIGMPKFVLAQVEHLKWEANGFDNDIEMFYEECSDIILSFNEEYMELMKWIKETNPDEFSIRSRIQELAKKRRNPTFS